MSLPFPNIRTTPSFFHALQWLIQPGMAANKPFL